MIKFQFLAVKIIYESAIYLSLNSDREELRFAAREVPRFARSLFTKISGVPKVEAYLQQRQKQAQEVRKMNEAKFAPQGLRDRLLARQAEKSA